MKLYIVGLLLIALTIIVDARTIHRPSRQIDADDRFWWNGGGGNGRTTTTSTTSAPEPSNPNVITRCINSCLRTPQYDPLCGTDRQTYTNVGHLSCAQNCGVNVELLFRGSCVPLG